MKKIDEKVLAMVAGGQDENTYNSSIKVEFKYREARNRFLTPDLGSRDDEVLL